MLRQQLAALDFSAHPEEGQVRDRMVSLIETQPDCFHRSCFNPGHFTGSALLLNADESKTLLTHHRFLDCWLQLGGHCDGDPNVAQAALREAIEESGISGLELISEVPADLDIHRIPENPKKSEPTHLHYDVRYFVRAPENSTHQITEESLDLRWFTVEEALALDIDVNLRRLIGKWRSRIDLRSQI